ncbi:MAG: TetR/AcrR family transcriptional regulator [Gemmatimonadota bacterium]
MPKQPRGRTGRRPLSDAAVESHREHGLDGVKIRTIATRAGVSPGAIYRHYRGREELLAEVVRRGYDVLAQYMHRCLEGTDVLDRLRRMERAYFDFAVENPKVYQTLFMLPEIPGIRRYPDDYAKRRSATFQIIVDRVAECIGTGLLRKGDRLEIALTIWAHMHGFMAIYIVGRFAQDLDTTRAVYDRSMDRLNQGLFRSANGTAAGRKVKRASMIPAAEADDQRAGRRKSVARR